MEIEKLLKKADKQDSIELQVFHNAVIKTFKNYQDDPTKANKNNIDAAREIFEQKKKELTQKYFPEKNSAHFSSLREVVRHLQQTGYKVSQSKISRDKIKNLIKVNSDGTVPETEVRAYTATLTRVEGNIDDLNDIHAKKTSREVDRLDEQIAKLKFERKKEEGKYIPKADFEAELAARAAVFDTGFRHAFNIHAREWIALVGGKPEKSADFLQSLNKILDEQLNNYATTKIFQVIFTEDI
jgi:hypothetical protein